MQNDRRSVFGIQYFAQVPLRLGQITMTNRKWHSVGNRPKRGHGLASLYQHGIQSTRNPTVKSSDLVSRRWNSCLFKHVVFCLLKGQILVDGGFKGWARDNFYKPFCLIPNPSGRIDSYPKDHTWGWTLGASLHNPCCYRGRNSRNYSICKRFRRFNVNTWTISLLRAAVLKPALHRIREQRGSSTGINQLFYELEIYIY